MDPIVTEFLNECRTVAAAVVSGLIAGVALGFYLRGIFAERKRQQDRARLLADNDNLFVKGHARDFRG